MTSYNQEAVRYWENSALDGRIYGVATQESVDDDEDSPDVAYRQRAPSDESELTSPAESGGGPG